jgi:ATP-dependent helicase/nuclease subunit B
VVPSRQRARAVQLAHAAAQTAHGKRVWASADVLAVGAWQRREAERAALIHAAESPRLLTAAEEWWLWRQCVREATSGLALLDVGALAESLQRSRELVANYALRVAGGACESESGLLAGCERAFVARCRTLHAASAAALFALLPRAGKDAPRALWRGFDTLAPRFAAFAVTAMATAAAEPPAQPTVLRAHDAEEECEQIAAWCAERLQRAPDARLLVMAPGGEGRRERLAALIRQSLDPRSVLAEPADAWVGIEGGLPLARAGMIAQALTLLAFLAGEELELEPLSACLRAPYWTSPSAATRAHLSILPRERGLIALAMRDLLGVLQLAPRALLPAARAFAAQLTHAATTLTAGGASAQVWSVRFAEALRAAGWPGAAAAHTAGQQTLLRWHELLEEFGGMSGTAGMLTPAEALALLDELATHSLNRPADEDVSVTLSGVLADPIVRYDGIWVAGLDADSFPLPPQPDAFIPLREQLEAGVPAASVAARLAQARALLAAWHSSTPDLVLSSPARRGDLELLPSPLLGASAPQRRPTVAWLPARLRREGELESLSDAHGVAWPAAEPLPRGTRSVDLQNQCPFRAYAELRLGSVRPEAPEPGVPPQRRGELLHAALQYLWARLGDSRTLADLSQRALDELIERSVTLALADTLARPISRPASRRGRRRGAEGQLDMFAPVPAALARECRRATRLIRRLCELERRRPPFHVEGTERESRLALAGATMRLRIDRVDRFEGGGRAILDYKSGRRVSGDWYGERPTHPQLLAYACALGADVAALATVTVSAREVRFDGIARAAQLLPEVRAARSAAASEEAGWRERQDAWRDIVARLIGAFLAGEATVDPKPGACAHCHVIDICRIGERASGAEAVTTAGEDE